MCCKLKLYVVYGQLQYNYILVQQNATAKRGKQCTLIQTIILEQVQGSVLLVPTIAGLCRSFVRVCYYFCGV